MSKKSFKIFEDFLMQEKRNNFFVKELLRKNTHGLVVCSCLFMLIH